MIALFIGYCKLGNVHEGFITLQMGSFMKIKLLQNGQITLLFIDVDKSCPSQEFLKHGKYVV